MNNEKIIYQGAEAKICKTKYMGFDVVKKRRIHKSYRIDEIDNRLIFYRTKEESKLMTEARKYGVSVPIIFDVDSENGIITMEYLKGNRIKDILNDLTEKERHRICKMIGESIAKFHNNKIIHGDITTSNMIYQDDRIHFIDFGLGEKNGEIEAKGVDLHVLMEAIESTHSKYSNCFDYVLEGYKNKLNDDANLVIKKIAEIVKRGRYR
ncbi:MAG: Kae1-associated serine/threonine protein kinase [Thermoplasmatales archaeon]|nr:MAG: Kae1-associated serine/threonine protein kinase [Thermoplasmatales archaeon]